MRRPTMRSRGQGRSRRPTPRPSRPVRGGPKGPPVRAVPKNPPKPRPVRGGSRGRGGTGTTGPSRATQIRSGKSDVRTPRGTRVTAVPKAPPKRVKETLAPTKKTPPNTGTSTRTPQRVPTRAEQLAIMNERIRRSVGPKPTTGGQTKKTSPATGQPRTAQLAKNQRQPTAAERRQMEAALRAREAKAPTQRAPAKTAELQRRLFNDAQRAASKNARPKTRPERGPISVGPAPSFKGTPRQTLRPPAPTGSRVGANLVGTLIRGRRAGTAKTPPNTGTRGRGGNRTTDRPIRPRTPRPPTPRPPRPTTRPRPRPFNSSSSRRTPRSRFMGR